MRREQGFVGQAWSQQARISRLAEQIDTRVKFTAFAQVSRVDDNDKWNFCLKAAIIAANRRDREQMTAPEPHTGLQGKEHDSLFLSGILAKELR